MGEPESPTHGTVLSSKDYLVWSSESIETATRRFSEATVA
jgi:hypothetical protein